MSINIPGGFRVANTDPIDGRVIVNNESERLSYTVDAYEGMLVYQKDTDSLYVLFDTSQKATNNGWKLVSPAGSDKQVQFVSGSSFSGSANLTYNYTTNTLSGTTTQFTTITGSNISGSGANITNITASNITNFTNDVRAQFTQGTNITIVGGVISSTAGGGGTPGGADTQIQFNSGSTFSGSQNLTYDYTNSILSGTTAQFTTITGSNITGTTGQLTTLSASYISASYIDFDTNLAAAPTFRTGRLFYNPDTGDLAYDTSITDIVLNIGQQTVVKVVNNTGAQINKGKLVFISGGVGDNPQINTASWDTDTTSARTIGMVMRDISNGSNGYVILNGVLSGVDTAAYVGGTTLFLSSSGDYTSTRPTQPLHGVRIGEVVRQHATVGSIFINIQNGYELEELHDVLVTTPSQGNLLTYNSSSALWVNSNQLSGNYGITGSLSTTNALTASAISASGTDSRFLFATFDNISVTAGDINAVIGNTTQSTGKFTTLSASSTLQAGGAATIAGNLTVNGGQTSVQSFTASAGISSSAGLVIGGNARVLGNITTDNNLIVSGNTTLGNALGDIITVTGRLTASNGLSASVINVTDKTTTRTNLGLAIGADVQAYDSTLQTIAGIAGPYPDSYIYFTASDTAVVGTVTSFARTLLDDISDSRARITLGLEIGTDVQPYDLNLTRIAGLTTANNTYIYFTGSDSPTTGAITSLSRTFLTYGASSDWRIGLGLEIGTDVQKYNVVLNTIASMSLAPGPNSYIYFNASSDPMTGTITVFGRSLLDDSTAADARTTLGLGNISTQNSNNVSITGGSINGTQIGNTVQSSGKFTSLSASSTVNFANNVYFDDVAFFNSAIILGNDSGDGISLNGTITTNIIPNVDDIINLGSSAQRWSTLYVNDVIASGSNGQVIVGTGSTNSIVECSTGASNTYRGIRSSVGATEKWFAGANPNDDFVVRKDSVNYLTVDPNGKLAIIQASDNNTSGFRIYDADASAKEYWDFFISASATGIANCLQIRFNGGSEGGFFSSTADQLNIDFTGQHRNIVDNVQDINIDDHKGLIVVSAGKYINTDMSEKPSINESLPTILLSNIRNQKSVWGVISNVEDKNDQTREYRMGVFVSVMTKQNEDDNRIIVNSIGEGGIWVCNINGNLENGDYITTCEIPGYGMKQDDDLLHNYTVAKITQDCSFELNNPNYDCVEFEFSGSTYRKAFVGCTYHCG